ncbi:E3 ubiquitin-protein ligase FANCL-like isoform X2 [Dreissena polymorpha]|uniref:E3 ubiquitin-protein ligase FANCL-like isoform X2 n=1 Tax=Dreissena polymorpha TaxID=45954 RepID=UPI002263B24E|nr:E3 ubiquitin-protein ligase FANCL-like isoform X2 [Dreissena polymorpha]
MRLNELKMKGALYRLEVKVPASGSLSEATVKCDANFTRILNPFSDIIKQRLSQCDSLHGFLKEIQSIAENQLDRNAVAATDSTMFCRQLLDHIELLGWDKLEYVSDDFREVHMVFTDVARRKHVMKLYTGKQYPRDCPKCSVQLPVKFDLHWSAHATLTDAYGQFEVSVDTFQDFWNKMAEIDAKTWVLEPEKPTHAAKHRRIAINPSVSVQITVDPNNPRVLPDCMFLGSDQAIKPLRQSMNANISAWNEESGILDNLGRLLNVTFPSPATSTKEEFRLECGICYSYRLEEEIPSEVCNESRCQQVFHQTCLVDWLRALSSSRQSFNTIFGNCPYCEKAMTVKLMAR